MAVSVPATPPATLSPAVLQAIASLSPVQCKLLEYKVSSITEVSDVHMPISAAAAVAALGPQPTALGSRQSGESFSVAAPRPRTALACWHTHTAHGQQGLQGYRPNPPTRLQGIDALVCTRVVIKADDCELTGDCELPQVSWLRWLVWLVGLQLRQRWLHWVVWLVWLQLHQQVGAPPDHSRRDARRAQPTSSLRSHHHCALTQR